jgi:hypothetical protein
MENENVLGVPEVDVATAPAKKKIKDFTETERKAYQNQIQDKSRAKKKAQSFVYNSKLAATKSEALELLEQRILNPHVREVCYDLGLEAAEAAGVIPNKFFWQNGLTQALASKKAGEPQPLVLEHQAIITSEVIHQGDAYAIWDCSVSWREPDVTFTDFIAMRKILKSNWFELGQFIGVPLEDKPHKGWAQFLPQFEPSLRPGYTRQEQREWLSKQKSSSYPVTTRDYLLMAARGSMKSSSGLVFLAQAILCAPSLRLLLGSETTALSRKLIKAFRAIWETGSDPSYERFQFYFPEYCVESGSGSILTFTSPMRHLVVPEETAEAISMEMAVQGRRFDIAWLDDCIGKTNTGNHEQRQKSLEIYGAILKLRETGAGLACTIGTAWVHPPPGEVGDLYYELMKRNDADPEHPLAVKVEPAWILKPQSAHKFPNHLNQLIEDDVQELAFPSRLTFKMLMKEARFNIDEYRSQFLCEYLESEESRWTPTFTLEELQAKVKPLHFFDGVPVLFTCAAVDTAFSLSEKADRSSICIAKVLQYEGRNIAFVTNVIVGRWKYSDLAVQIVEAFQRHGVQRAVIERNGQQWQDLQAAVQRNAVLRGFPLPMIQWNLSTATGTSVSAKVRRVKNAEILFNNSQIFFAYGPSWNEGLFAETVRFKGQRSGSSIGSKDDQVDSLGMLASTFLVKDTGGGLKPTAEQEEMERRAYAQELLRQQHQMYFGTGRNTIPHSIQPTVPQPPRSPIDPVVNKLGLGGFFRR